MAKARKIRICLISEGQGQARVFSLPRWLPLATVLVVGSLLLCLSLYCYQSYNDLKIMGDNSVELEALRFTNASQKAQLEIFAQRLSALDQQLSALKTHEREMLALKRQTSGEMGLNPETSSVAELLPRVSAALSWPDRFNGVGGSEELSGALSATAVSGRARDIIRGLHRDLDRMQMAADETSLYFSSVTDTLSASQSLLAATPLFLPLEGRLSAKFGLRDSPFNRRRREMHRGLDIPVPTGTAVRAPAYGTVLSVGEVGGYGLMLTVAHGYSLITRYAHLSEVLVEPGQRIRRGQRIALSGNSGRSTGPHLHYETIVGGVPVDPLKLLPAEAASKVVVKRDAVSMD